MTADRLAVTGVGIVSALGPSAERTFERLIAGERGFSEITGFDTTGQRTKIAAEVRNFDVAAREEEERMSPLSRSDALALAAARDAVRSAFSGEALGTQRYGIAVGATTGGMLEAEGILAHSPLPVPGSPATARLVSYPMSSTADRLADAFGGPVRSATMCGACSSGATAIIQGALWLRTGQVDCVVAGGTDALCRLTVTGFNALGATDTVPCRPFDRRRAGLTLGEGAAFLVLETEESAVERGARVLAWLSGWAAAAEAHHITQPEPSGRMPARLLRDAMEMAGLGPTAVDYLNAHGTGTSNDAVEAAGIRAAFGADVDRLLVSSSKGQIGHTLGAAGAIEAAVTVLALHHQQVPPTGGLVEPDEACRLRHVLEVGCRAPIRAAMSSAFGFGGAGAVLLFERGDSTASRGARPLRDAASAPSPIAVTGMSVLDGRGVRGGIDCAEMLGVHALGDRFRPLPSLEAARSRRFDAQAALVTLGAERAIASARAPSEGTALIAGIAFGSVERTVAFLRAALEKGPRRAPPAEFPHLLPSAASGNASIYLGLTGPVMTASGLDASAECSVLMASDVIEGGAACAVAGGVVVEDTCVRMLLAPLCETKDQGLEDAGAWLVLESIDDARRRSARVFALLVARGERPIEDIGSLPIEPPRDGARSVVISSRDVEHAGPLLARHGWSGAAVIPARGGAGVGLACAAARIGRGDVDEALVLGWTARRVYAFQLRRLP